MDEIIESRADLEIEYTAPTVVDYGTLVEATGANHTNNLNDVPIGQPEIGGFSG
jgi:hypothetical protein